MKATEQTTQLIAEAIQGLGEVPNGRLYAQVMGYFPKDQYDIMIQTLKDSGKVKEKNHLLTWVG
jgi:hypothetical protein